MRLIITGHDFAGKSTILKEIYKREDSSSLSYMHLSYREPTDYEFYKNTLMFSNFLMDRCFLDELIYPMVFKRKQNLNIEEARDLVNFCKEQDIKIIILECSNKEIERRINLRSEEEPEVLENIKLIKSGYRWLAEKFDIPIIDTTDIPIKEVIEKIDSYNIVGGNNG